MREIKFRGKTLDGRWIHGDLWQRPYAKDCVTIVSFMEDAGTTGGLEVIPETVGQYTGLKDKNGRKIFEGDILYILQTDVISNSFEAHDENRKVLFYEGSFCIENYAKYENVDIENHYEIGLYHTPDELEVIGNIYENPELI